MRPVTYNPTDEFDGRPAPLEGCTCVVCQWARSRDRPVRPSDPQWMAVMRRVNQERPR
jgi:hypothetical protein